jgi:hypothetical protein
MAFIPASNIPSNKVGKIVTLSTDHTAMIGTITKGSRVKIIEATNRGYTIQDLDSGIVMHECGFDL